MQDIVIDGTFAEWRSAARELLAAGVAPANVAWCEAADAQQNLLSGTDYPEASFVAAKSVTASSVLTNCVKANAVLPHGLAAADAGAGAGASVTHRADLARALNRVPREFLRIAASVACHSDRDRWHALYQVLFRLTHGEPSLLEVATDPAVHRLFVMDKAVRREVHKMHAFVRFRAVDSDNVTRADADNTDCSDIRTYIAWFEPLHNVVERASALFVRRFTSMHWSILTPRACAHWSGSALQITPGVTRETAPGEDRLEELWRSYYAHIFNPARVGTATMQAEMPRRYWVNLPEARLIGSLTREAPARVARMLSQLHEMPADIPEELRSEVGDVTVPERTLAGNAYNIPRDLDAPGSLDTLHDPGVSAASVRSCEARARNRGEHTYPNVPVPIQPSVDCNVVSMHNVPVRIGTASWTDPTLLHRGVYYPDDASTPEARLRYYASQHALVEIDSTYYVPPTRAMAAAWTSRTPDEFVFDVKAFALMTGHAAETKRMPDWLRRLLPRSLVSSERIYAKDLANRIVDEVWSRFLGALGPLRDTGKLGPILLQFPRWFVPSRESASVLRLARERLGTLAAAVEFRNPEWVTGPISSRTIALLEKLQLTYVVVDAPPGTGSSMPPIAPITTPGLSVVRLHGRRSAAWEAHHTIVSERYRYLYDQQELSEWAQRIDDIAWRLDQTPVEFPDMAKAKQGVHVVFNNCHANYGTTNTDEITAMLIEFDRQRRGIID